MAERELLEGDAVAGRPGRRDQQLVRLERSRELRDEEVVRREVASLRRPYGAAEDEEAERKLRTRIRVRNRAADRPAVPRHEVADVRQRLLGERVAAEIVLAHRRADVLAVDL